MIHFLLRFILLNFKANDLFTLQFQSQSQIRHMGVSLQKKLKRNWKIKYELDFTKNQ